MRTMDRLAVTALFGGIVLILGQAPDIASAPPPKAVVAHGVVRLSDTATSAADDLDAVIARYCVVCHNDVLLTGNLSLANFQVENAVAKAETAERMIRKLRAGMMPPPGMPRPAGDTLEALVEALETTSRDCGPGGSVGRHRQVHAPCETQART